MAKILLCDDDPEFLKTAESYLSAYNHQVDVVETTDHVFGCLREGRHDFFICSAWATPEDGYRFCQRIRERDEEDLRAMKILIFAPGPVDRDQFKFLKRYDLHFMIKYKSPEAWQEKIERLIEAPS